MAETAQREVLQSVSVKQEGGEFGLPILVGASFENVVDTREDKPPYTLAQFYDNVMEFFTRNHYLYYGDKAPINAHNKIWIDTSKTNQDGIVSSDNDMEFEEDKS